MRSTKIRILIFALLTAVLAAAVLSGLWLRRQTSPPADPAPLTVTSLNVGKADCTVIRRGNTTGIIDAGTEESFTLLDHWLRERDIREIDYLILTHYDRDHIGGAIPLLAQYTVDAVYLADYESAKKLYPALMRALESGKEQTSFVNTASELTVDGMTISILPATDPAPLLEDPDNCDNNLSLVCMLTYGDNRLLFTGDVEKDRIRQMLDDGTDLDADWIKMPHHGGYQKIEKELFQEVTPAFAVISTSSEEAPSEKLLELLSDNNVSAFCTYDGNVETRSDGHTITVQKEAAP